MPTINGKKIKLTKKTKKTTPKTPPPPPKGCKECGGALVDEDDELCHKCYHQSVPEGECWCENLPPKCECESDDEYSITESGCDKLNCPSITTEPFHDCDPTGKGNRVCKESGYPKSEWCEECLYLDEPKEEYVAPAAVCPPVNKKAQRTFVNLGIDPKTAERFKPNDTCDRCGHFFKRGMIKEYHYASKNCQKGKPYSETEKGQNGKGGEHTARKARKAADPTRELTKEINAFRKTNELRGFFTYKDDAEKREAWDTLYKNLEDIPKFLAWIINNIDDAKRIISMRWDADTIELLGKITDINITVEKAKTTVSLGGVELGSMGGGTQQVSVRDYMDGNY